MALVKIQVDYDYLIVLDWDFLHWVRGISSGESIFKKLMYIHNYSIHKKNQNFLLISKSKLAFPENPENPYIKASCKVVEDPSYLNSLQDDEITKNIFFAINIASEKPYRCYIFTSPEKAKQYSDNEHYDRVKSVSVKGGEDAIKIINRYFQMFCSAKDLARIGLE